MILENSANSDFEVSIGILRTIHLPASLQSDVVKELKNDNNLYLQVTY